MPNGAALETVGERPIPFTQDSVKTMFVLFTVFYWIGYPLVFVGVGIPFLIASIVFDCIILYRLWWLLQDHGARTTPGKAVGFCFIPFFCFYWWFVAYLGVAKDTNAYMDNDGIDGPRMSCGLAMFVCIIAIISSTIGLIPMVAIIVAIPASIVGFLFVLQEKRAILAIMEHRQKDNSA